MAILPKRAYHLNSNDLKGIDMSSWKQINKNRNVKHQKFHRKDEQTTTERNSAEAENRDLKIFLQRNRSRSSDPAYTCHQLFSPSAHIDVRIYAGCIAENAEMDSINYWDWIATRDLGLLMKVFSFQPEISTRDTKRTKTNKIIKENQGSVQVHKTASGRRNYGRVLFPIFCFHRKWKKRTRYLLLPRLHFINFLFSTIDSITK